MNGYNIGDFALSLAGHDKGKYYVIYHGCSEYVYLVDGKIRKLDRMKKKKLKHVTILKQSEQSLTDKIIRGVVKDEEIKRAIKLLQQSKGGNPPK